MKRPETVFLLCPHCGAMNTPNASPTITVDQTGTKAECSNCSVARQIEDFLPKENR